MNLKWLGEQGGIRFQARLPTSFRLNRDTFIISNRPREHIEEEPQISVRVWPMSHARPFSKVYVICRNA